MWGSLCSGDGGGDRYHHYLPHQWFQGHTIHLSSHQLTYSVDFSPEYGRRTSIYYKLIWIFISDVKYK